MPPSSVTMFFTIRAARTPVKFMMPTRERSIPPAIMHAIIPRDRMPYSGNWYIIERRFISVK